MIEACQEVVSGDVSEDTVSGSKKKKHTVSEGEHRSFGKFVACKIWVGLKLGKGPTGWRLQWENDDRTTRPGND